MYVYLERGTQSTARVFISIQKIQYVFAFKHVWGYPTWTDFTSLARVVFSPRLCSIEMAMSVFVNTSANNLNRMIIKPKQWCGSGSRSRYTISVNILKNPLGSVFYDTGPGHNTNQVFPWFSSYHYQNIIDITFTPLLFGIRNKKNIDRKITCSFSQPNTKKYTHVI